MTGTQISTARAQAAAILKAWGSKNLTLLHRNLVSAAEESDEVGDSGECERLELLSAIAARMRVLLEADELCSAVQFLPLLRHLATPPPAWLDYAYHC